MTFSIQYETINCRCNDKRVPFMPFIENKKIYDILLTPIKTLKQNKQTGKRLYFLINALMTL